MSAITELMRHVEKVVRPLRITRGQRSKLREELLGHLKGVFEEEIKRCSDHEEAVRAAINRFGSASSLTAELRQSMPWYSAVLSRIPWFSPSRKWPESTSTTARRAWSSAILLWILVGIPWCAIQVVTGNKEPMQAVVMWFLMAAFGVILLSDIVWMLGFVFGIYGLPKSRTRAMVTALATCLAILAVCSLLRHFVNPSMHAIGIAIPVFFPWAFLALSFTRGFAVLIRKDEQRSKRTGRWERLGVDD